MITAKLMGGLGNQLFQIASAIGMAIDYKDRATFDLDDWISLGQGHPPTKYRSTIYRHLNVGRINFDVRIKLHGLFSSDIYFRHHRNFLLELFAPTIDILDRLWLEYGDLTNACAIHIRRGDFLTCNRSTPIDRYLQAIAQISPSRTIVFCDDRSWCSTFFADLPVSLPREDCCDEILDLYAMSLCGCNIIGDSTFGWWAAWLNQNPHKLLIRL